MTAMKMDAEIKALGFEILARHLGLVEAERFITLIQRERFDYTQWRQNLFAGLSGEEISRRAMEWQRQATGSDTPSSADAD
jgi:hypothetical protein